MPELPEVETVVSYLLTAGIAGHRIVHADVRWPKTAILGRHPAGNSGDGGQGFRISTPRDFVIAVTDRKICDFQRRGKQILIGLDNNWVMLVHLRMSGMLYLCERHFEDPYCRLVLYLDNGKDLRFRDPRKFGRCILTSEPASYLNSLGLEPLSEDFNVAALAELLMKGRSRKLKPLLLDQQKIAGLGNIYVDEALWYARIHPSRKAYTIRGTEVARLCAAIQHVLSQAIRHHGTRLGAGTSNFGVSETGWHPTNQFHLKVFRRTGSACYRCGEIISRSVVAQRGTHFCPKCQILARD